MKKLNLLLLAVVFMLYSAAAWADGIDFSFSNGVLSTTGSGGLTSAPGGSSLDKVYYNPSGPTTITSGLGTVYLTTGAIESGSLATGATLSSVDSSISVVSNAMSFYTDSTGTTSAGTIDAGTALFTGTFVGNLTWTNMGAFYTLQGNVSGNLSDALAGVMNTCVGCSYDGTLITLNLTQTGNGGYNVFSGNMGVLPDTQVPEPGMLTLLGTGGLALAGSLRKKIIQ